MPLQPTLDSIRRRSRPRLPLPGALGAAFALLSLLVVLFAAAAIRPATAQPSPPTPVAPPAASPANRSPSASTALARAMSLPPPVTVEENSAFRVEVPGNRPELACEVMSAVVAAREKVGAATRIPLPNKFTVLWCDTGTEFRERTGFEPESTAAAAVPQVGIILINGPAWSREGVAAARAVVVHEYAHLVIHAQARAPIPRWLDEGLAMHLADQWSMDRRLEAITAQLWHSLPPLSAMERDYPTGADARRRGYLMAYLATHTLAQQMGSEEGKVDVILERLGGKGGAEFARSLWRADVRAGIELGARSALGSRARNWLIWGTSGTALWLLIVALFVVAYLRKRRRIEQLRRKQEEEDAWAESLTQRDIEDIYGPPADTIEEAQRHAAPPTDWEPPSDDPEYDDGIRYDPRLDHEPIPPRDGKRGNRR